MPARSETRHGPYRNLGELIAAARKAKGIRQPELARRAGLSVGYVGHIERGRRRPAPAVLQEIARALDYDYNALSEAAGYLQFGAEEVAVLTSPARADWLRAVAMYRPDQLHRLVLMARAAFGPLADTERNAAGLQDSDGPRP